MDWLVRTPYSFQGLCRAIIRVQYSTASLHKLAEGRKLAATHLNVSNRQMCGCTGFKSGSYNKSYYNSGGGPIHARVPIHAHPQIYPKQSQLNNKLQM